MTEYWKCNRCKNEYEFPIHNKLLVLVEKPDCEVPYINYDICQKCNENVMVDNKWWLKNILDFIEKSLPKPV